MNLYKVKILTPPGYTVRYVQADSMEEVLRIVLHSIEEDHEVVMIKKVKP